MKRSSRAESDLFVHIDVDSSNEQPASKVVKMEEGETSVSSQQVLELQQKIAKLEKDFEIACRIAGEAQVRVRFLEDLIEEQRGQSNDAATVVGGKKNIVDELQKKLTDVSTQLEDARKETTDAKSNIEDLEERLNCMTLLLDTERAKVNKGESRVNYLTNQLDAEKSPASEDRKRAHARMYEMARHDDKVNGALEKKVATLTRQLDEENARSKEDRLKNQMKLDAMARHDDKSNRELEKKVVTLTQQLDEEKTRSKDDRLKDQKRIGDLTRMMTQYQQQMQQLQQTLPDRNNADPIQVGAQESISIDRAPSPQKLSQLQQLQQYSDDEVQPPSILRRFPLKQLHENRESDRNLSNSREVAELRKTVASLTRQLEGAKAKTNKKRMGARKQLRDESKRLVNDERKRDQERDAEEIRIDELLAEFESDKQQQPQQAAASQVKPKSLLELRLQRPKLHQPMDLFRSFSADRSNILSLSRPGQPETIPYHSAVAQLRPHYFIADGTWVRKLISLVENELRPCIVCRKKELRCADILVHFFSPRHYLKIALGTSVSLADFEYWLRILKSIPKPAAVAAPENVGGAPKNDENEEPKEDGEL